MQYIKLQFSKKKAPNSCQRRLWVVKISISPKISPKWGLSAPKFCIFLDETFQTRSSGVTVSADKNSWTFNEFKYLFRTHSHNILSRHVRHFWHHIKKYFCTVVMMILNNQNSKTEDTLTSNSKIFKTQFGFQELSTDWKKGKCFFKNFPEWGCSILLLNIPNAKRGFLSPNFAFLAENYLKTA